MKEKKFIRIAIFVVIIVLSVFLICIVADNMIFKKVDEYKITYQIDDIRNMYDGTILGYSLNDINEDNLKAYNILLNYVDKELGKDNYYLVSLYDVNYGEIDKTQQNKISKYVIKIIPKQYKEEFDAYGKEESNNPYLVMYEIAAEYILNVNKKSDKDYYDNFVVSHYPSLIVGLRYEEQIRQYFLNISSSYLAKVWYNPYFSGLLVKDANSEPDISAYGKYSSNIYIFIPYGINLNVVKGDIDSRKYEIIKMGIKEIVLCSLKEKVDISVLKYQQLSRYSSEVDKTLEIVTTDL